MSYLDGQSVFVTERMEAFVFGNCNFAGFEVREAVQEQESMILPGEDAASHQRTEAFIYLSDLQISVSLWSRYEDGLRWHDPAVVAIDALP